jgi:DNA-binding YbaB/EbfC family protein
MADLFAKMAEMQQRVAESQESLAGKTVTAEAGGGMVKVVADGTLRIKSIKIDPGVIDSDDMELMEDLIVAGVNKALDEASAMAKEEMSKTAGSLLPPGFDLSNLGM